MLSKQPFQNMLQSPFLSDSVLMLTVKTACLVQLYSLKTAHLLFGYEQ